MVGSRTRPGPGLAGDDVVGPRHLLCSLVHSAPARLPVHTINKLDLSNPFGSASVLFRSPPFPWRFLRSPPHRRSEPGRPCRCAALPIHGHRPRAAAASLCHRPPGWLDRSCLFRSAAAVFRSRLRATAWLASPGRSARQAYDSQLSRQRNSPHAAKQLLRSQCGMQRRYPLAPKGH